MTNPYFDQLDSLQAFSDEVPAVVRYIADAIPFETVPQRMKYTIAVNEVMLFASQFRRNILDWKGTSIPISSIGFVITGSGNNKDSSVAAARSCFEASYHLINERRKVLAKNTAMKLAREAGVKDYASPEAYKPFYRSPNPIFVSPSTNEGFIQHLNDLDDDKLGAGYIYSGEFGFELANSQSFRENLCLLSELYDLGKKEVKVLKGRENQSKEIKGFPTSAFFVSSPNNILFDEAIKRIFKAEFSSKLARRSWFCFVPEVLTAANLSPAENIAARKARDLNSNQIRDEISAAVLEITTDNLNKLGQDLTISDETQDLFYTYEYYNNQLSESMPTRFPISALVRKHLQWKALKFSGAIAIFEQSDVITADHYLQAIRFCEMLDKDMQLFEIELVKEPYEQFVDHMHNHATDGKFTESIHNLRKLGYVSTSGSPKQRMRDLIFLAGSYDKEGIYTNDDFSITYEAVKPTANLSFSYKEIDISHVSSAIAAGDPVALRTAKSNIAKSAYNDFQTGYCTFAELSSVLEGAYAYSPFEFRDGTRNDDSVISSTKWLVFDIDHSDITASEVHFLLSDINHHIALGSDPTNEFKFRVLVELDAQVDIPRNIWPYFYKSIAVELSLPFDPLPQAQIFYSYASTNVLSTIDGSPIKVRDHIMSASDKIQNRTSEKPLTKTQIDALKNDPYSTFYYAFECPNDGSGSRTLVRAARHAKDLHMSVDDIEALILSINDYWVYPMDSERLEHTVLTQIRRWR